MRDDLVRAALDAGSRFWRALADDDDEALTRLLDSAVLRTLARDELHPHRDMRPPVTIDEALAGPGPAIAARLRDHLGFDRAAGMPGLFSQAALLEDDALRLTYVVAGFAGEVEDGTPLNGWRLELALVEGAWLIDPIRSHDRQAVEEVDLAPFL